MIISDELFIATWSELQSPQAVANALSIATPVTGQVIYVSNGDAGAASLAVYDGSSWKRVALGATISAT